MNTKFAYPLTDSTFKLIFGQEKYKQLTIDFLNNLLERQDSKLIVHISFIQQEKGLKKLKERKSILDINCKDQAGNSFIVKIHTEKEYFFDVQALYYAAHLLSKQFNETESYNELKPVIIIGILDFILYKPYRQAISHHMICDMSTGKQSIDLMELHFIELSKFNKKVDELASPIDIWMFFLKNAQTLEAIPQNCKDNPSIVQAFHLVDQATWTKIQTEQYEKELRAIQKDTSQDLAEAKELSQAKELGAQAKAEAMAIKLLTEGFNNSFVMRVTELSMKEIEELQIKIRK